MIAIIKLIYQRIFWSPEKYARKMGVKIGKGCRIKTREFGSEPYLIEIGDHVQLTADVKFFTHGGGWVFRRKESLFDTFGKIVIGNNVYIGNNTLIMPGVVIEDNVIIGSGTVLTKSVPENSVVAGNPGKIIGTVDESFERLKPFNVNTKMLSYEEKKNFLLKMEEGMFIHKAFMKK